MSLAQYFVAFNSVLVQCAPPRSAYGECDRVYTEEIGDTEVTIFDKLSERGHVATIVIRGSSHSRMDDIERAIDDAINTYKALTRDCQVYFFSQWEVRQLHSSGFVSF